MNILSKPLYSYGSCCHNMEMCWLKYVCTHLHKTNANTHHHGSSSEQCSSVIPTPAAFPRHVAGWVNPEASWESFVDMLGMAEQGPPTPSGPSKKKLRSCKCSMAPSPASTDSDLQPQDFSCASRNESEEESAAGTHGRAIRKYGCTYMSWYSIISHYSICSLEVTLNEK